MGWQRCLLWPLALLLTGCAVVPSPPALPTPVRPPEISSTVEALQAALEGDYPLAALTIRYEIGNEAWEGRTVLVIQGNGSAEVTFAHQGKQQIWSSSLSGSEFLALVRLLVEHELWNVKGQREMGAPDEARPVITVEAEGFEPLSVALWLGEAQEQPDFEAVMVVLSDLATTISGGIAR